MVTEKNQVFKSNDGYQDGHQLRCSGLEDGARLIQLFLGNYFDLRSLSYDNFF
ncbi:hypothetical protein Pse7429DRAFT_3376 [Pseudanabaena biceps PCC 7429]|uniref:Uncharacterized protein n=1 Tax=Pseudanabaena biceps PCC 7429 TaxID=927668 RepID=L8MY57_9CYAN|nr:hypothetical protein Pse7429DRAFT_3376 [Pseudanabaena biceps PCC 7429]